LIGIAIGNGLSREGFDLSKLKGPGRCVVGCNWIFRDYDPDYLVSIDSMPCAELKNRPRNFDWLTRNVTGHWLINVHPDGSRENVMEVATINGFYGKNSGIIAASFLSKHLKCPKVYMIGFDFFRVTPGATRNDIYHKGLIGFTKYDYAWNLLLSQCPQTQFIRVGDIPETEHEFFYEKLKGFNYISYPEFEEVLSA